MDAHGELPCPACGYARRGLEHAASCPECGAAGFHGRLVVTGQPESHRESRRAGCVSKAAFMLNGILLLFLSRQPWSDAIATGIGALLLIAAAIWLLGRVRRKRVVAAGGSLERIAWDFTADGVRVREFASERLVPYSEIEKCWSAPGFMFTGRTRVQLEASGFSHGKGGFPTIMVGGPSHAQRDAVARMKRCIAEGKGEA